MPTRSEIQDTLAASQEQVLAFFDGLSPEALKRPCTASGVPGEAPWRAKDHFAHLSAGEIWCARRLRATAWQGGPGQTVSLSPANHALHLQYLAGYPSRVAPGSDGWFLYRRWPERDGLV